MGIFLLSKVKFRADFLLLRVKSFAKNTMIMYMQLAQILIKIATRTMQSLRSSHLHQNQFLPKIGCVSEMLK